MTDPIPQPLLGRAALVTGANRGLGREIARAYLEGGADLYLCARDEALLRNTAEELGHTFPARRVLWAVADVGREDDVSRVAADAVSAFPQLQILVNNAGVYGPMGLLDEVDWSAWVQAVTINLMGSTLLLRVVLPHFRRQRYGKIVQLSGGGATNPLPRISAYAASKAAIVRLIETVALECAADGIDANCIAPGALNTRMLDEAIEAGPDRVGADFHARALSQKEKGGTDLGHGAALAVFLASAASDGISGRLISAVWDRWEDWPAYREELSKSDVYTLRRIAGRDRGLSWGDK